MLEKMSSIYSGFVALILGYFFGQRQTQQFAEQARLAVNGEEIASKKFEGAKSDVLNVEKIAEEKLDECIQQIKSYNEEMEKLKQDLGVK